MKNLSLFCFFLLNAFAGQAQDPDNLKPYLVKDFQGVTVSTLKASTNGGNIIVKGGSEISRVEVYILDNQGKRLSDEDTKKRLDKDYELNLKAESGILLVLAKHKAGINNWKNGLTISFTIQIPSSITTDISTSGGNIVVSNMTGASQKFITSGGNMVLNTLQGNILGKTSGGNMVISHSGGQIDLNTSGGNIMAEFCKGGINLATSGGNILIKSLNGDISAITSGGNMDGSTITGNLTGTTNGGNIVLDKLSGSVDISTNGGSIVLSILNPAKFIKAQNSGGDIDLKLPSKAGMTFSMKAEKIELSNTTHFNGSNSNGKLNGTWNGGGIPVSALNTNGSIRISFF